MVTSYRSISKVLLALGLITYSHILLTQTYGLIILLDDSEETITKTLYTDYFDNQPHPTGIGPLSYTFIIALEQEAAPILVSKSIIDNIQAHHSIFNNFIAQDLALLHATYNKFPRFNSMSSIREFKEHAFYMNNAYKELNKELHKLITSSNKGDHNYILRTLSANKKFLQQRAPSKLSNHLYDSLHQNSYLEIMTYVMCTRVKQLSKQWIIKQPAHNFYLFIPLQHLKRLPSSQGYGYLREMKSFSDLELASGIKINHMPDIKELNSTIVNTSKTNKNILSCLKNIFITKKDVSHIKNTFTPTTWILYLLGHGASSHDLNETLSHLKQLENIYISNLDSSSYKECQKAEYTNNHNYYYEHLKKCAFHSFYKQQRYAFQSINAWKAWIEEQLRTITKPFEGTIATIPLPQFTALLLFLNTEIDTQLFFYISCYAGGKHLVTPYTVNGKLLTLSYPIIVGTLAENSAYQELPMLHLPPYTQKVINNKMVIEGIKPESIQNKKKELCLVTSINFNDFFKMATDKQAYQSHNLIRLISLVHPYSTKITSYSENIASIRYQGTTYFKPIAPDDKILLITEHYLNSLSTKKPITITSKKVLFLYTPYVNHTLIFNKNSSLVKPPLCISMIPGKAAHILDKIEAPHYTLAECINCFLALSDLDTPKVFWIKKLTCKKTPNLTSLAKLITSSTLTLYDIFIIRNIATSDFFSTYDQTLEDKSLRFLFSPVGLANAYLTLKVGAAFYYFKVTWPGTHATNTTLTFTRCLDHYYKKELETYFDTV